MPSKVSAAEIMRLSRWARQGKGEASSFQPTGPRLDFCSIPGSSGNTLGLTVMVGNKVQPDFLHDMKSNEGWAQQHARYGQMFLLICWRASPCQYLSIEEQGGIAPREGTGFSQAPFSTPPPPPASKGAPMTATSVGTPSMERSAVGCGTNVSWNTAPQVHPSHYAAPS